MDTRLTSEQRQLRASAARIGAELGPGSVADLEDGERVARLEKAVESAGLRRLRADGASGVEVALVAEEFGRALVDVPFLGPVLAHDLLGETDAERWTVALGDRIVDARDRTRAVTVSDGRLRAVAVGAQAPETDLTRRAARPGGAFEDLAAVDEERLTRWTALALTVTTADLLGVARGAQDTAVAYAKVRAQYGHPIGDYQAVAHLLAESRALIEGAISTLLHAAWAVDELAPEPALHAARIAKVYTARAARTICETAIQVHGGIGNTWECTAHLYLRRALVSAELFPVRLEEIDCGLS
ncbi:acyl-CoA dehydrogenase family protein [Nocardia takedensis]